LDYIAITPSYPPIIGGVEKHVFEVHSQLKQLGLKGLIIVLKNRPPETIISKDVVWIKPRKIWGLVPKTTRLVLVWNVMCLIIKNKPKAIHFHDLTISPFISILKFFNLLQKSYVTFHGWEGVYPPRKDIVKKRQHIASQVKGSMAIGAFIEKWYGTNSNIISYGGTHVNLSQNCESNHVLSKNPLKLAYFGRLEADTGLLEVIKAIIQYFKNQPDNQLDFSIYGNGTLKNQIEDLILNNDTLNIEMLPAVPNPSSLYTNYDVIIASGYLTIIEALAVERIVIAYYNNPIREDYLKMHPAAKSMNIVSNANDISKVFQTFDDDINKITQLARPGWEWAKKQTWEALAKDYLQLWATE